MRRTIWLGLLLAISFNAPLLGQQWAVDMFETTSHDFGNVARSAKAEYEFRLTNVYLEDLHISSVRSSCGCTQPRIKKADLKTYETGAIIATINTAAFQGTRGATVTVTFDKPYYAEVQLQVSVFIRSDVAVQPGSVTLGELAQGEAADRNVTVTHSGSDDWKVMSVRSDNSHIRGEVVETARGDGQVSYRLNVHVDKDMPAGYVNDHVTLVTNDQGSAQVPVAVEGRVLSGITVSPASLFMGVVKPGEKVKKQLVVHGKKPFRILSIKCDGATFEFDSSADQQAKTTHVIPVTFVAGEKMGKVSGKIQIETDLGTMSSGLPAYAVVANGDR
jgi:hypothetical protein